MKKQSKMILLGAAGFVLLLVGMKAFSSSGVTVDSVEKAKLTLSESSWAFGDIPMSEGIATKEITLTNDSPTAITITGLETSCMCTTAQIVHADGSKSGLKGMVGHGGGTATLSETIEAGETATLRVNFDPNAHGPSGTGPITRNVTMRTNSRAQSQIELTFSGNVIK